MRLVWSGFPLHEGSEELRDSEEGTILGGVALEIVSDCGEVLVFESIEDEVELAAACAQAVEDLVRA